MGIVYRAHDLKLRRDVALKVIAPALVEDEEARARFLREAQALAGLSHPNIVTVFDLAEDTDIGLVFIVMELLNGLPLRRHITNPQRPPFYDMAVQVCKALEHAHDHGILHRDIKPENIFVCNDGTIKLMDFGLARLVDGATVNSSTVVTGTIAYMSPEQLRGGHLDARADLYGLGVLFYEYLCGYTPFMSDSAGTMLLKHLTEKAPSLRTRVPAVSAELDGLIGLLLSKDPDDRYASAAVLRDTLERIHARASTVAAQIAAPTSAGPAMPAMIVPVAAPAGPPIAAGPAMPIHPSYANGLTMPARRPVPPRTRYTPPKPQTGLSPEMRTLALFFAVVLVALAVYAVGEAFHYMSLRPAEPPKKPVQASKSVRAHASAESGDHRRARRRPPAGHEEAAATPAGPADSDTPSDAEEPAPAGDAATDHPADDGPTDDKSKSSDSDANGV